MYPFLGPTPGDAHPSQRIANRGHTYFAGGMSFLMKLLRQQRPRPDTRLMTEGTGRQAHQFLQALTATLINHRCLVMASMRFFRQTAQTLLVECVNRHTHRLITTMQGLSNRLRLLPFMAFEKDLTATYRKGRW